LNFREPFEAAQQQEKEKQLQEAAKKVADKTPEKKPSKIVHFSFSTLFQSVHVPL
jgi:hypothetical protein